MSNTFTKITPEDLRNKGVVGLPDAPQMTVPELQAKFDEIATDVIVPKFNNLVDEITAYSEASDEGLADEVTRAKAAEEVLEESITLENTRATEAEGLLSDAITNEKNRAELAEGVLSGDISAEVTRASKAEDDLSNALRSAVDTLSANITSSVAAEETRAKAVENTLTIAIRNAGDMKKSVYDSDNDGVVDNSERLGGQRANYYATFQQYQSVDLKVGDLSDLETQDKTSIVAAINEAAQTGSGGEDAEAWAVGQRDGQDVPPTDPTYHNNSKYYSQQASSSATDAETAASDASDIKDEISDMIGTVSFDVDFTSGEIVYTNDAVYTFSINQTTGNLEWELVS